MEVAWEEWWLVFVVSEQVFMFSSVLYHTYNVALVHVKSKEVILIGNALNILFYYRWFPLNGALKILKRDEDAVCESLKPFHEINSDGLSGNRN
jgi:hypothetical protein